MNRSMHYRCRMTSLEDELKQQAISVFLLHFSLYILLTFFLLQSTFDSPKGMFSEDMFDACVIELDQLIADLDPSRIHELWHVSSIDKKSEHFIVLYDNAAHLLHV